MAEAFQINAFQTDYPLAAFQNAGELMRVSRVGIDHRDDLPAIEQGSAVVVTAEVRNYTTGLGELFNPASINLTVNKPNGTLFFQTAMLNTGVVGKYAIVVPVPSGTTVGPYTLIVTATDGPYEDTTIPAVGFTVI
jgi:hypothetical protein